MPTDRLAQVRALFEPAPGLIYLDSATYGLPPRPTVETMHRAIDGWQAGNADWVHAWDERGENARRAFARLTGLNADEVALIPSVSVGVGTIAGTLTHEDEVIVPDDEFNSVLFPILVSARERNSTVRQVPFDSLADHIGRKTTLVAFSLVQSQSGRTARQREILDAAVQYGARTLVDATHGVPFVPVDPRADFVVCAAYKHLLCPRGVAFLGIKPDAFESVPPWLANWRSTRSPYASFYGGPLDVAPNAARYDVSLAWFSWAGAAVSLELLADWQQAGLLEHPLSLARRLADSLGIADQHSSVVSVPVEDADAVRAELASAGIKAAVRAGSVRLSTHVYNTESQIEQAIHSLARHVPQSV